jgi:diguanylate cyclase (GGDEF)-like protein/PAS domain S-box-containing protein
MFDLSVLSSHAQVACLLNNGEAAFAHQNYNQAVSIFENVLVLAQQMEDLNAEIFALQQLGVIHLQQEQLTCAQSAVSQALSLALEQADPYVIYDCHRQLAKIYKAEGQFEAALQHFEAAEKIRVDIFNVRMHSALGYVRESAKITHGASATVEADAYQTMLFRNIVEQVNVGIAIFQHGSIIYHNRCFQEWLGYTHEELQRLVMADLMSCADYGEVQQCHWKRAFHHKGACHCEKQLLCKDGHKIDVEFDAIVLHHNHRPAIVAFVRDITARKQIEAQLKESEAKYRSLFNHVPIGLYRLNADGLPLEANPAMVSMLGFRDRASFFSTDVLHLADVLTLEQVSGQSMAQRQRLSQIEAPKSYELQLTRNDGRHIWVKLSARIIHNDDGSICYCEGAMEDVTEIKAAQIALEELAIRDSLTHVYNRRHFIEMAEKEMARAIRFQRSVTVMMVDVDHFKTINDTYGHLAGDRVLQEIVVRIKSNLRQSDILARYGGEEFIILMPETNLLQAWSGGERLRHMIACTPFESSNALIDVTASIGFTSWQVNQGEPPLLQGLINQADQALYQAKKMGRNQTQAYALHRDDG